MVEEEKAVNFNHSTLSDVVPMNFCLLGGNPKV